MRLRLQAGGGRGTLAVHRRPGGAGGDQEQADRGGERGEQPAPRPRLPIGSGDLLGQLAVGVVAARGQEVAFHVSQLGQPVVRPIQRAGEAGPR